jgi:large subunit ribosomal protein L17
MRHNAKVKHFGRATGPRTALLRGLVTSLVEHGRIKTTLAKAKELRRHVEKAVTKSKDQTLHARRLLLAKYPNQDTVSALMTDIAPRFKDRAGGYTRILKLGARPGDNAEMAYIEFVDYAPKAAPTEAETKTAAAAKRTAGKKAAAKKKRIRKIQGASRRVQRANAK